MIAFGTSGRNNEPVTNERSKEEKSRKEFYERRPSAVENRLMKCPNVEAKSLPEPFTGILPQAETMVLERKQIDLVESHPLGFARCQVYNTYIIAEARGKLVIVDQHAAHERLVYECLKQRLSIKRQKLLLPETIEIRNEAGMEMVEIYKDKICEMGFEIEIETENKVIVKEIPAILGAIDVKEMLINIVNRLTEIECQ